MALSDKARRCTFWGQWKLELAAVLAITCLFVAMAVALAKLDGTPIFDNGAITLNAIISVLSTSSKAMHLFVLAAAISQWNWIFFASGPRRLCDFERVADASRGPLGSIQLLFNIRFRGGALVRFGALLTLLSIALDPFAQQLVQLDQKYVFTPDKTGATSVPWASRYSKGNRYGRLSGFLVEDGRLDGPGGEQVIYVDADFALQSAAILGIKTTKSAITQQLNFKCPSGECTFRRFTSLAVCSRCADLTSRLEENKRSDGSQYFELIKDGSFASRQPNSTEYRLPNGLFLNNQEGWEGQRSSMVRMTMLGTSNRSNTVDMGDVDTLIWSHSIIKLDGGSKSDSVWPDVEVRATECALYYCVKEYASEVHNTTLFEKSTALDQKRVPGSWDLNRDLYEGISDEVAQSLAFHPRESSITRTDLQIAAADRKWNISQSAIDGVSAFMQKTFAACIGRENCTGVLDDWVPVNGHLVGGVDRNSKKWEEQYEPSVAKEFWDTEDIPGVFGNIALSMSNAIRNGADNSEVMDGTVGVLTTVYAVNWPWIILHSAMMLGTAAFLLLTMFAVFRKDGQVPVWKGSETATMAVGPTVAEYLKGAGTMDELDERAKKISVSLLGGRGGRRNPRMVDDQMIPLAGRGSSRESDIGAWR